MSAVILRRALILVCALLAAATPALAQPPETDPRHFLPADVDAWLRLELGGDDVLDALNIAARSASLLQPARRDLQPLRGLEQALPLQQLDTAALPVFARDFAPWVGDELLLAWRGDAEQPLLILPAEDLLQALGSFSAILEEQDLLQRDEHQGRRLWLADRSSIAFTPGAVLIGPETLVRSALDARAGDAPGLLQDGAGMAGREATSDGQILSGWLRGSETLKALAALLAGDGAGAAIPLLQAFSQSVRELDSQSTLQHLALEQGAQALTFSLSTNRPRLNLLRVALTLHGDGAPAPAAPQDFNPAVLQAVPRNAMLVASGNDARPLAFNLLAALPLGGFGGELLGAFTGRQTPAAGDLLTAPDAEVIGQVVSDWLRTLWDQADLDLEHDLLRRLDGSYSLALLPRPNDPLPPLNMPWDLLLVAEVDDGRAALDALDRLLRVTVDSRGLQGEPTDGTLRRALPGDDFDDPPLQVWVEDGLLLLGTGAAPRAMQRALAGDNRLIDRARWQALTRDSPPQLYLDVAPLYATFLPQAAGPQLQEIRQLGLRSHSPAAGRHELEITLTLPDLPG